MNKSFWEKKWETGETQFHQDRPHPQLVKYGSHFRPGKVLVPLCGKSLDLLWLKDQGHEVTGIELSPIACEAFFQENRLAFRENKEGDFTVYQGDLITLWCGDFFKAPAPAWEGVTNIYDRAALIALPPELRGRYARHILTTLDMQTCAIERSLLITVEYSDSAIQGPPFSVTEKEVQALFGNRFRIRKAETQKDIGLSARASKAKDTEVLESIYLMQA